MDYIFIITAGFLSAILVITILNFRKSASPIFNWFKSLIHQDKTFVVVEIVLVGAYVLLYKNFGFTPQFISYSVLSSLLAGAAYQDIRDRMIPYRLIIPCTLIGFVMAFINPQISIYSAATASLAVGLVLWIISVITKGGLGMGDVKLFACAGLFLGVDNTLAALFISTIISGLVGAVIFIRKPSRRKEEIPFAPFVFVGSILAVLW